ncbi:MAG: hypothetical protein MUF51_04955 [Vicinamibacteria bacterium]|jgi:hypothetical protein|nr:hypothetical protein [Vicinamibacteria bacterium]
MFGIRSSRRAKAPEAWLSRARLAWWSVCGTTLICLGACNESKRLIEFGWDSPDTRELRLNLATMEASPFDGCVFHVRHGGGGNAGSFTWEAWGSRAFTDEDLRAAAADLRAFEPRRFRHNFLRLNVTPGQLDWFDDHRAVMQNAYQAARLAKLAHARGILLDTEQYQGRLFDYAAQRQAGRISWSAYAARARARGRAVMTAFQAAYPGLIVLLTFGHSLPWEMSARGRQSLAQSSYGLLAPFLDGLYDVAYGATEIVDGYEFSYGFKTAESFASARASLREEMQSVVGNRGAYARHMRTGFGIWLDNARPVHGWHTQDFSKNYFSPDEFARALAAARVATDEFVWVYSETPRFWPVRSDVPRAYLAALERFQREATQ